MLSIGKDKDSEKAAGAPNYDSDVQEGLITGNTDNLQRHLNNRQIQLIAIGGSIGTGLFVSIGTGLYHGGPGSLLLAYAAQSMFLAMVNNCIAEMSTAYPVSGGFIRLAGKWVDDALGFMVGWNFLCTSLQRPTRPHRRSGICICN
jgi:amino acid transporter